jgi:hypothetical protein
MSRVSLTKNDLEAVKAAFAGVRTSASRLLQMEAAVTALEQGAEAAPSPDGRAAAPDELVRAASAHALAAAAFSGLLHRLFAPAASPPASVELLDE